jgi:hypothetical protein
MAQDQSAAVTQLVRDEEALEARMDADAAEKAHALIQGYLGPDHKVLNMSNFYSALVQTLKAAREQGQADVSGDVLTLT